MKGFVLFLSFVPFDSSRCSLSKEQAMSLCRYAPLEVSTCLVAVASL